MFVLVMAIVTSRLHLSLLDKPLNTLSLNSSSIPPVRSYTSYILLDQAFSRIINETLVLFITLKFK